MSNECVRPLARSGSARFKASSIVRPNTNWPPRMRIACSVAWRITGSPSRPTARRSALAKPASSREPPRSTWPVSISEKVAALTNVESESPSLPAQSIPASLSWISASAVPVSGTRSKRLGEAHQRDAFVGAEAVALQERVEPARLACARAFDQPRGERRGGVMDRGCGRGLAQPSATQAASSWR
jgi:hypothetical protein